MCSHETFSFVGNADHVSKSDADKVKVAWRANKFIYFMQSSHTILYVRLIKCFVRTFEEYTVLHYMNVSGAKNR